MTIQSVAVSAIFLGLPSTRTSSTHDSTDAFLSLYPGLRQSLRSDRSANPQTVLPSLPGAAISLPTNRSSSVFPDPAPYEDHVRTNSCLLRPSCGCALGLLPRSEERRVGK